MIYKSRFKFYKIYKIKDKFYKAEDRGHKIQVGKYKFFVNEWFTIFEETTGRRVQVPPNFKPKTLEDIEDYLNYIYVFIDLTMKEITSELNHAEIISENDYYEIYAN